MQGFNFFFSPFPQAKLAAKRPQAKASSKKPQVPAKKGKGVKGKGRKGKKLQLKFHIDCRQPVEDGIMNAADFVRLIKILILFISGN